MYQFRFIQFLFVVVLMASCRSGRVHKTVYDSKDDGSIVSTVIIKNKVPPVKINTGKTKPSELIEFAETLIGTPYKYGSAKKEDGLDCSGFVMYVLNHFGIKAPRSSKDYTNCGKEVSIKNCEQGDIILFTGSNASSGQVGHMGFIYENKKGKIKFIHSASGGNKGVTISGMSSYYVTRFVKVNRIFN